jgi:hypothetical protein
MRISGAANKPEAARVYDEGELRASGGLSKTVRCSGRYDSVMAVPERIIALDV